MGIQDIQHAQSRSTSITLRWCDWCPGGRSSSLLVHLVMMLLLFITSVYSHPFRSQGNGHKVYIDFMEATVIKSLIISSSMETSTSNEGTRRDDQDLRCIPGTYVHCTYRYRILIAPREPGNPTPGREARQPTTMANPPAADMRKIPHCTTIAVTASHSQRSRDAEDRVNAAFPDTMTQMLPM